MLFGGTAPPDTWVFDGIDWQPRSPATLPPGRRDPGMAYDPVRDRVVMFGGCGAFGPRNDTWEWGGSNWTSIAVGQTPPRFDAAALAYDAVNNRIVMAAAREPSTLTSTLIEAWTYDGVAWTPLPLAGMPRIAGSRHDLVASPAGEILLVDSMAVLELVGPMPTVGSLGSGCGVPSPRLSARDLPTIGNPAFGLDLSSTPASAPVVFAGSDTAASTPLFGCTLHLASLQATATEISSAGGFATRYIPIPNQLVLLGTGWTFQALALQAAAPTGFALSDAVQVVIGIR